MGKKKPEPQGRSTTPRELPELPSGRPMPEEANPGGTEGVEESWTGGASNVGEVLNPEPRGADTTYSTPDAGDVPKNDVVYAVICERCGEPFQTAAQLNVHVRSAHHHTQQHAP